MLTPGTHLDNYEIVESLGCGGYGCVWRARDLTIKGRDVAIKELIDPTPERLEEFLREMEILASLKHPGIVTFYHALEQGQYLVMEYITDGSLRKRLGEGDKSLTNQAATIVGSLCSVLHAVHAKHVVHRDLKPDNLFLQGDAVRVGDFGIAEIRKTARDIQVNGTLSYMAPELFKKDVGPVDHRVDIYAAGIILFELLSGLRPFEASDAGQLIYKICFEPPPIPRNIPAWLQGVLQKSLAKSPDIRFQSAQEMQQAISNRVTPQLYPAALIRANRANYTAERLLGRKKINAAISSAEQGLHQYPEHPSLLFTKARGLMILRRAKDALPLLLRARQLDPGIQCEMELGYVYNQMKAYGNAISCLTDYARRRPDRLKVFALLMEALYCAGEYRQTSEIGAALCREDLMFLNNSLLADALEIGLKQGVERFKESTKGLRRLPGYMTYNMLVLDNAGSLPDKRIKEALYFAAYPDTIISGNTTRKRIPPLRIEAETKGRRLRAKEYVDGFVSVGRLSGLDITLRDDAHVSRFHGLFYYRDALYHYRDLNSTQGSYIDEQCIEWEKMILGMEAIRIGETVLRVSY